MTLSNSTIFTTEALDILNARLNESESLEDFFSSVDSIVRDEKYLLQWPGAIEFSSQLDPHDDGESATIVLEAVGDIDRVHAADPRLWTFLALVTFRDYLLIRWPKTMGTEWKSTIKERWLLNKPSRRKLIRHGVARLWWVATLTYDPECKRKLSSRNSNPHAYTHWAFTNQNRIQSIFERQLGSNSSVMWAIIEILVEKEEKVKSAGTENTKISQSDLVKKLTKEVHLRAGYRYLEMLEESELLEVIDS